MMINMFASGFCFAFAFISLLQKFYVSLFICLMLAMLIAFSTFSVTALAAEVADNSSELTETATDVLDKETFENLLTELAELGFFDELFMAFFESSSEDICLPSIHIEKT